MGIRHSGLSNASLFNPPGNEALNISVFKELVLKDIEQLKIKKSYNNMKFREGLESLKNRDDIIVRPAAWLYWINLHM